VAKVFSDAGNFRSDFVLQQIKYKNVFGFFEGGPAILPRWGAYLLLIQKAKRV
jgi:hypothetical protein